MQFFDWDGVEELLVDDKMKKLLQDLVDKLDSHLGFELRQGRLLYKQHMVLAKHSPRIPFILKEFHDTAAGGHSGFFRTYKRISALLFWEGMKKDIQQYVPACQTCQRNKYEPLSPAGLSQPLAIPTTAWTDLSMDFLEGLPKARGVDTILVVVNRLSKYVHYLALAHPYTAK